MDEPQKVSRNAQVLKYLTERCQRVGRTRLLKLAYLSDLVAREFLGRPLTGFEYIWYDHGPFDRDYYTARDELVAVEVAEEQVTSYPKVGYEKRTLVDLREPVQYELSNADMQILDYVYDKFGDLPLQGLLDIVYESKPMQKVQEEGEHKDRLPMESVDNERRDELGFDLEELSAARDRIRSGQFVTLEDFERELRAKVGRGGSG